MQNNFYSQGCIAVMGSMTQALRAQKVLADAAVRADVVKADAAHTRLGCAYALSFPCTQENNVLCVFGCFIYPERTAYTGTTAK